MAWQSLITSASDTGCKSIAILPDSTSAKSRISSISASRYQPACKICARLLRCASVGGGVPDSINWEKPRIAFSGERNSWLIADRNSDFARFAVSAAAVALLSVVSYALRSVVSLNKMATCLCCAAPRRNA